MTNIELAWFSLGVGLTYLAAIAKSYLMEWDHVPTIGKKVWALVFRE